MSISYPVFELKKKAITLTTTAMIMVVLLIAGVTVSYGQQQEGQQLLTSQPTTSSVTQNVTTGAVTLFESTNDNFRVGVPQGWVIQDVNNTGFVLATEVTEGYGILAQLCPAEVEEGQQQEPQRGISVSSSGSCQQQQAQEEKINVIRYPNLGARLGITLADINNVIPESVLDYQMQKLQEVGYRIIEIENFVDTAIPVHYSDASGVPAAVPATLVEMTYSTDSAPSEMRRGYIILTSTNITPPNLQTITGYGIFYEGSSSGVNATEQTTTRYGIIQPVSPAVGLIFDSFELLASEEGVQTILAALAQQAAATDEPNSQEEEGEDE